MGFCFPRTLRVPNWRKGSIGTARPAYCPCYDVGALPSSCKMPRVQRILQILPGIGGVAERFKARVLKTRERATVP